ncbi:MAG: hypothetical protein ACPIOQ_08945 [Promethearchaeia archaeon]
MRPTAASQFPDATCSKWKGAEMAIAGARRDGVPHASSPGTPHGGTSGSTCQATSFVRESSGIGPQQAPLQRGVDDKCWWLMKTNTGKVSGLPCKRPALQNKRPAAQVSPVGAARTRGVSHRGSHTRAPLAQHNAPRPAGGRHTKNEQTKRRWMTQDERDGGPSTHIFTETEMDRTNADERRRARDQVGVSD